MKLDTIKDLSKLIDLCRKKGVESFELNGLKVQLGAPPPKKANSEQSKEEESGSEFTEEQVLLWSSTPTN